MVTVPNTKDIKARIVFIITAKQILVSYLRTEYTFYALCPVLA